MARRAGAPEVSAGSMADIAFLLLIFFLVTTTIETDAGLDRMLPPIEPPDTDVVIKQKNIFQVNINKNGQLLADDELIELKDLRSKAMAFLDNGGDGTCSYCQGRKNAESSDNPSKAIISLKNDRETKYSTYITVQNELVGAYNDLRNREAQRLYKKNFVDMEAEYLNPETDDDVKEELKEKVKKIQDLFPQKLSEAETSSD
ncbi:MAG: biopolymer transporter ExbD [Maribacter dokdonensis]|jgi:biopolymer transport protein ExbD|uniref:Biopolymer transport protein ExbD n=1 Tax=Maribacter dokdonensis TaxID=320912 RepID=A0A1H4MPJ3_9FLAO|nr:MULTISPECIES: biopolymer transporter ExbD [Maribacter]HAF75755.1 biopolymer transporter ExbD [Maribacter sp.]APA64779.1 biopolymer transporter ExbD [Maribacter sp. 1_2014MBL_MicDiv]KSA15104.1 Biopolymer transport protein ExbD/TolR [Maribacter dokdonensis DSW-8]MDP2525674.1 biopolymer transporter ExbD [Maribacter dokdonensis]PHN94474.1 biopolymer transporter ExbD [Maribacter sp. 6B07]|tara:strand:- start:2174 stop:2779 length:606 start_codon:yes stop_codon:yes gene_type:complete